MKKVLLPTLLAALCLLVSCGDKKQTADNDKLKIIFETDLGNDVDDVLALDMVYKYIEAEQIDLLGIMINKNGVPSAELADILNTWYGYPTIPIGIVRDGADCETDAVNYAKAVCDLKDSQGNPVFKRSLKSYDSLPDAQTLYRKLLSAQPDASVVIVSVGFSTNLARLLATPADQISPLTGKELVAAKVKQLCVMGGCMNNPELKEYNIVKDIKAAQEVFAQWPTPIVVSPFELGVKILYPASSIENDFAWVPLHPMVEAYKSYLKMPYDRPTWDLTTLLYAVEGPSYFTVSPAGKIEVRDDGSTIFTPFEDGNVHYLSTDEQQNEAIKNHFVELISQAPQKYAVQNEK